jgi:hypothetical protein
MRLFLFIISYMNLLIRILRKVIPIAALVVLAFIITGMTQAVPSLGRPKIIDLGEQQMSTGPICSTSQGIFESIPSHNLGLPIPYITHYNWGGCGYEPVITWSLCILDCIIWYIVLLVIISSIKTFVRR